MGVGWRWGEEAVGGVIWGGCQQIDDGVGDAAHGDGADDDDLVGGDVEDELGAGFRGGVEVEAGGRGGAEGVGLASAR